jgi:hypothetical protein
LGLDGSVEENRGRRHLAGQFAVDVLDRNATLDKPFVGFYRYLIAFVFFDHRIESALDGFRLGLGAQELLGSPNLGAVSLS